MMTKIVKKTHAKAVMSFSWAVTEMLSLMWFAADNDVTSFRG
jgi:hypothetical protein